MPGTLANVAVWNILDSGEGRSCREDHPTVADERPYCQMSCPRRKRRARSPLARAERTLHHERTQAARQQFGVALEVLDSQSPVRGPILHILSNQPQRRNARHGGRSALLSRAAGGRALGTVTSDRFTRILAVPTWCFRSGVAHQRPVASPIPHIGTEVIPRAL